MRGQDDVDSPNEGDDMKLDQDMSIDCDESNDSNSVDDQESTAAGDLPASLDNPLNEETKEDDESDEPKLPENGEVQSSDDNNNTQQEGEDVMKANDVKDHDQTENIDALGVASENGTDDVEGSGEEGFNDSDMIEKENDKRQTEAHGENDGLNSKDGQLGTGGGGLQSGCGDQIESNADVPNPFRDPGTAEKYWHRRLNLLHNSDDHSDNFMEEGLNEDDKPQDPQGAYEFTQNNQSSATQVLAYAEEKSEKNIIPEDSSKEIDTYQQQNDHNKERVESQDIKAKQSRVEKNKTVEDRKSNQESREVDSKKDKTNSETIEKDAGGEGDQGSTDPLILRDNQIVTDTTFVQGEMELWQPTVMEQETCQLSIRKSDIETLWGQLQSETYHLSRRLCEKLRLVMEPLVASKLQGDYRSGKRLNMKRIISYIASGYRKDKIWLRRTKPAKRDYRVLLAVDDSESMKRSGAGLMALRAMAMLINGMTQLEIGQLGIASFGEEMKILHPFHSPFTSDSGVFLVNNFKFEDKRTRTALCVESAMASMAQDSSSSSPQLLVLISDGRIERDSRSKLRSSLREMSEQNILVVMLIVEGCNDKKRDSILDMKEVSFEGGRPKLNFFMENYPFPYYIIVEDMNTLPEVLGDALRQWFEILSQTQR